VNTHQHERAARLAQKRLRFKGAPPKPSPIARPSVRSRDAREPEVALLEAIEEQLRRRGLAVTFHRALRPRPGAPESVQRGLVVVFCDAAGRCWRRPVYADLLDQAADRAEFAKLIDREIRWSLSGPSQPRGPIRETTSADPDSGAEILEGLCADLTRSMATPTPPLRRRWDEEFDEDCR
jgi:hypothetical protein